MRILGTGASFAFFGIGALALGLVAFPVLALTSRTRELRERRMQRLIHGSFRVFVAFMQGVGVLRVELLHPERLRDGTPGLLIANHPTLIDYVLLVSRLPQADVVVKRAHWSNPFVGGVVRGAGYLPNDTGEETVEACVERLRAGRTVLLFPEGTRSPKGELGPFQRGAAHVALAAGVDALPVTIHCHPPGLMRGQAWYDVPERRMQITLDVGEPLATNPGTAPRGRASRALTAAYREYFEKGLGLAHG